MSELTATTVSAHHSLSNLFKPMLMHLNRRLMKIAPHRPTLEWTLPNPMVCH